MNFQAISNSSLLQITLHWAFLQLREKYQQSQICRLLLLFFSCYNVSSSLQPHELQHPRLPCPSLSPRVCSNSCPLSQWYHPTISTSVASSSCPQSSPGSGSFLVSQLFTSGSQNTGTSALASVLPVNIQDWFPLGLTALISLLSKGHLAFTN